MDDKVLEFLNDTISELTEAVYARTASLKTSSSASPQFTHGYLTCSQIMLEKFLRLRKLTKRAMMHKQIDDGP